MHMYHDNRSVFSEIHLPKDNNNNTPRPITDDSLKRVLKNARDIRRASVTSITPKDEKILSLMVRRGEGDRTNKDRRFRKTLQWDRDMARLNERTLRANQLHHEQMSLKREEERQEVYMNKLKQQKRRLKTRAALVEELNRTEYEEENNLTDRHKRKAEELAKLIKTNQRAKQHQEQNWWKVNSDEFKKKMEEVRQHELNRKRVDKRRDKLQENEITRLATRNKDERMYFTDRFIHYERKATKNRAALNVTLERKHHHALSNFANETRRKEKAIQRDIKTEEEKRGHVEDTHDKLLNERLDKALQDLNKTAQGTKRAQKYTSKSNRETVKRVQSDRSAWGDKQQHNSEKLNKETKKWRKKLKKEIKDREKRMEEKQQERQQIVEKARKSANSARTIRSHLQYCYGWEDFDRKALHVKSFHSIGQHRPPTQQWNDSSNISLL